MKPVDAYNILKQIGTTKLHHANTVTTSCTFLEQGGLLSRSYVENHNLTQTPQYTDAADKRYGVWNLIFLDTANIHYRGGRVKGPNQYGPVLFVLNIDALLWLPEGSDVSITKDNPSKWYEGQTDDQRWFQSMEEIQSYITDGKFRVGEMSSFALWSSTSNRHGRGTNNMARGTIIPDTLKDGTKRYRAVIRIEQNGQKKQVWKTFAKKKDAEDYLDRTSPDVRDQTYREVKKATFGQYVKHVPDNAEVEAVNDCRVRFYSRCAPDTRV